MSPHYAGIEERTKLIPSTADENVIRMIHWSEMDHVLFPLLVNIGTLQDSLKLNSRIKETQLRLPPEVTTTIYSPYYLPIIVSTALVRICEEDWVTMRMFDIVTSREMAAFTNETLKQNGLVSRFDQLVCNAYFRGSSCYGWGSEGKQRRMSSRN